MVPDPAVVFDLKGFLSFRYFVRHAYSFEIDPKVIDAILDAAPDVLSDGPGNRLSTGFSESSCRRP
jgi:hypothetical protein